MSAKNVEEVHDIFLGMQLKTLASPKFENTRMSYLFFGILINKAMHSCRCWSFIVPPSFASLVSYSGGRALYSFCCSHLFPINLGDSMRRELNPKKAQWTRWGFCRVAFRIYLIPILQMSSILK